MGSGKYFIIESKSKVALYFCFYGSPLIDCLLFGITAYKKVKPKKDMFIQTFIQGTIIKELNQVAKER